MSSKKKAAPKKEDKIIVEPGPVEEAAPVRPEKRIAIVGCSDSKDTAPYGDKSWEIWSMNNTFNYTKRQDMWFEVHPIILVGDQYKRRKLIGPGVFEWSDDFRGQPMKEYMLALAHLNCPVYMQQHWDIIPKSLPYPIDDITHRFGRYFTNSVSYIIAMAIISGATEIGCFGIDMAAGSEYGPQRPSCEWMLGIAAGLGIRLNIPPQADLLKTSFLYGFEEREQTLWESKLMQMKNSMMARRQKQEAIAAAAERTIQQYHGAEEAVNQCMRVWSNLMTERVWKDKLLQ
jgi:hypothetical protein